MPRRLIDWLAVALLCTALGFGGATGQGFWSDTIAQLAGLVVIFALTDVVLNSSRASSSITPLLLAAVVVAVPAMQLVPLPPSIWSALPGRSPIHDSFVQAGIDPPWLSLSLSPETTLRSCLSLAPPIAIFLSAALLGPRARSWMALAVLTFVGLSIVLGAAQMSGGPSSPLRFYATTNLGSAVGFFANRNHYSALLYSGVCFLGAWTIWLARKKDERFSSALVLCIMLYVMLASAIVVAGSRAAIGLAVLASVGVGAIAVREFEGAGIPAALRIPGIRLSNALLMIAGVVVISGALLSAKNILDVIEKTAVREVRLEIFKTTWNAANAYAPFGGGFGTFASVYQMFEGPQQITPEVINRAHNDWLEILLEGGLLSVGATAALFAWFVTASAGVWRKADRDGSDFDQILARASMIVVILLALHSLVDYPLRTTAMASVFAFACGNLVGCSRRDEIGSSARAIGVSRPSSAKASPAVRGVRAASEVG